MTKLMPASATDIHERSLDLFPDFAYFFSARLVEAECRQLVSEKLTELQRIENAAALLAYIGDGPGPATDNKLRPDFEEWWTPVSVERAPTWYWRNERGSLWHFAQCSRGRFFYAEESN